MLYCELARRQKNWRQIDVGHDPKVRISANFLSLVERGLGLPTPDQIQRLARKLGIAEDLVLAKVPEGVAVPELTTDQNDANVSEEVTAD